MPDEGAEGLVKDLTRSTKEEEEPRCHACEEEGGDGEPTAWCAQCQAAYCTEHIAPHMLTNIGHVMSAFSDGGDSTESTKASRPQFTASPCPDHTQPLVFHCLSCRMNVCGHCVAIGKHAGHTPVALIADLVEQRKEKVLVKAEDLQSTLLPRAEGTLESVDKAIAAFSSRADEVRDEIQAAGQRVVEAVNASVAKKLQEVNNIDEATSKVFYRRHDDLKSFTDSLSSVVSFADRLKTGKISCEKLDTLLPAVEERVDLLSRQDLAEEAGEVCAVSLAKKDEGRIAAAVDALIGDVVKCKASSAHSTFIQPADVPEPCTVSVGGTAAVVIQAKDNDGEPLTEGGPIVTTQWLKRPAVTSPVVEVTDYDNGRYLLTFTLQEEGDYVLAVLVNGSQMSRMVSRRCEGPPPVTFNPDAWHKNITLNEHQRCATVSRKVEFKAVLGQPGTATGQHQWKVQVSAADGLDKCRMVGVAARSKEVFVSEKPYTHAYSWNGFNGRLRAKDEIESNVGESWKHNDIIHVHLDCDGHTLCMSNLRSGDQVVLKNLPDEKLFPFFCGRRSGVFKIAMLE